MDVTSTAELRQDPAELMIAFQAKCGMPLRPEHIEGSTIVPSPRDHKHNAGGGAGSGS
ncbi:hypothetical protein G5C60_38435 [Streptomyces sp. HC44]|uniref:Uncharacterized protein n=1 Tax=Streptomyces scabichelini TaxID=2711217 RepID=A0A6G4VHS1_9ACTN|nr:hypothetical protein [Streptomyces scabichelini]NGO13323.1 hypothetical protein [Streptomyces scabichelini]